MRGDWEHKHAMSLEVDCTFFPFINKEIFKLPAVTELSVHIEKIYHFINVTKYSFEFVLKHSCHFSLERTITIPFILG